MILDGWGDSPMGARLWNYLLDAGSEFGRVGRGATRLITSLSIGIKLSTLSGEQSSCYGIATKGDVNKHGTRVS